jgi:hypothetical protein
MNAQSEAMQKSADANSQRFTQMEANVLKAMTHSNSAMTRVVELDQKVDKLTAMMEKVTMYIAQQTQQVAEALPATVPNQSPTASLSTDDEMSSHSNSSSVAYMNSPVHKKVKPSTTAPFGDQYKDPSSEAGGNKC